MVHNLLIRADATSRIGFGHIMRCLALAQVWQEAGGRVYFAVTSIADAVEARLRKEGFEILTIPPENEIQSLIDLAESLKAVHIILDGRQFSSDDQFQVKQAGLRLLVVDDYGHAGHYYADYVLNPDLVSETMYISREPHTRLLLGPQFALLRREFTQTGGQVDHASSPASRVLISMGGSDPENMTWTAMSAIERLQKKNLDVRVIIGGANSRFDLLSKFAGELPGRIEVLRDVSDMPAQMEWAEIAISAASVTLWELLYMGPVVLCWPRYAEDVRVVEELNKRGAVLALTQNTDADAIAKALSGLLADATLTQSMRSAARKIVDGQGAQRVVDVFSQLERLNIERTRAR